MQIRHSFSNDRESRPGKRISSDSSLSLSHFLILPPSLSLVRVHNTFDAKSTRGERELRLFRHGSGSAERWGRGTSKLVQSYHEGRHVRDDLIIRDCSSAGSDGGTAGVARGRGGWKGARICQGCRTRAQIYKADAVLRPHKVPLARWAPAHYTHTHTRAYTYVRFARVCMHAYARVRARVHEGHVRDRVFVRVQGL